MISHTGYVTYGLGWVGIMLQRLLPVQEAGCEERPCDTTFAPRLVVCDDPPQRELARPEDLSREAHCIFGMPIDALSMPAVVECIQAAAKRGGPYLISTPNLNFLVQSLA